MNNGFKNEKDIVDLLDKKEISEFSEDIKKEIKYTFKEKKVFWDVRNVLDIIKRILY